MSKKKKKYGIKNVSSSFGRAIKKGYGVYKKRKAYVQSDEYQQKVERARQRKLKALDYQIELRKRKQKLASPRQASFNGAIKKNTNTLTKPIKKKKKRKSVRRKRKVNNRLVQSVKQRPIWAEIS